jgi:hypothetical protein
MGRVNVTGYCLLGEEQRKLAKAGVILTVALILLTAACAVLLREPLLLTVELPLLAILFLWRYLKKYDRFAAFELSEAGVQTTSTSETMCRRFAWEEVSVIQITTICDRGHVPPRMDCYVFVRGQENALIKCRAMEEHRHIFSNPNRIAIPKDEQTEPFVTEIAERYGIPVEHSYLA